MEARCADMKDLQSFGVCIFLHLQVRGKGSTRFLVDTCYLKMTLITRPSVVLCSVVYCSVYIRIIDKGYFYITGHSEWVLFTSTSGQRLQVPKRRLSFI
jgi:hypothetical protein